MLGSINGQLPLRVFSLIRWVRFGSVSSQLLSIKECYVCVLGEITWPGAAGGIKGEGATSRSFTPLVRAIGRQC